MWPVCGEMAVAVAVADSDMKLLLNGDGVLLTMSLDLQISLETTKLASNWGADSKNWGNPVAI
jgi:hypothetical protein